MFKNFDQLLDKAKSLPTKRLVVASAEEKKVLKAVQLAIKEGLVKPLLVGDGSQIKSICKKIGLSLEGVEVIDCPDQKESCIKAVKLVSSGQGDILLKGLVDTSTLLKAVLNKEYGLRTDRIVSHIAMVDAKKLGRIVFISDGGMNIRPDLEQKIDITQNAIDVAHRLGWEEPKVAILAAIEKVNPQMVETIDAAVLAKMADRRQITGGLIDGPLAIDNALSKEAARIKQIDSPVAGVADILIVPEIVAGNILGKSCIYLASNRIVALISGTSRPVVVTSRANTAQIKLVSIAAAVLLS